MKIEMYFFLFLCFSPSLYWEGLVIFLGEASLNFSQSFKPLLSFFFFYVDYSIKSSQEPYEGHILLIFI